MKNKSWIIGAVLILLLTWYVSEYWFQFMILQGNSMEPTYHNGQFLVLDKHTKKYNYNDVIAIEKDGFNGFLVKRIVALPGDTVFICDGILYVNDNIYGDNYSSINDAGIAGEKILLCDNEYFVLGDNLNESKDSRYTEIGLIEQEEIKGIIIK